MSPHRAVFVKLVQSNGWTKGAELGVDKGILFDALLRGCPDLHLIGVDVCPVPHRRARCEALAAEFADRASLIIDTTHNAAEQVPDGSLDFVFIDADHSHAAVADDIRTWAPKVRHGGWLGGHDYNSKFPGVQQAVREAFKASTIQTLEGSIWGAWL